MATLALAAVGAAVGGALLPAGISLLGATLTGAAIGSQIGALAGGLIDQSLFGSSGHTRQANGPRLSDLRVTVSGEGGHVPRVYGRARLGGQVIWATDFEEEAVNSEAGGSGKGGGAPAAASGTQYNYYANFAVAICEGEITRVGRVWADGKEFDLGDIAYRVYRGSEDQAADSLISAKLGAASTPAYRGVAYIVFERMALARFGNRIPQLSFEVVRAVDPFEQQIRAVTIIPGAGEFVYEPTPVQRDIGLGVAASENVHTRLGGSDWSVAIDQLQDTLPSTERVSLFVSWFGTDLRAAQCQLRPGVDTLDKDTSPLTWSVAGLARAQAYLVSQRDGRAAYGGTPSDSSVVAAIEDLKARGLQVTLSPFPLMDIPEGNALTDPYGGSAQAPYPWRGRVTVTPAPGRPGTVDKTAAAATQIAAFIGTATPAHFVLSGKSVVYSGPAEWSYRRMVLHNANLAKAAGGIDAFIIGSELRGLTWARSGPSTYPFVTALAALAADVKSILGTATKVTYAADWSEYFGHQPADGSGDVYFHLDPLWASSAIDAIGIDVYWPLADWRSGPSHLDRVAGVRSTYDLAYLKGNVFGGEGYDWYYASDADRRAQSRTPIADGAGKPWTFRFKDIRNWWSNPHHNRPGGVEATSPTAWVPQSKPVWFTEVGCPAIDLGANQPNVFFDPKSAESALPYFSSGARDDFIQRRYLQAIHEVFDPAHPDFNATSNPLSTLYGGRMVDPGRITAYTWDARPHPAFPADASTWGDSANWGFGHWLTGRLASAPLAPTIAAILRDHGFTDFDVTHVQGTIAGYVIDRIMSAREALQPLELSQFIDAYESSGAIHFASRAASGEVGAFTTDSFVESKPGAPLIELTRQQETELPAVAKLSYYAAESGYRQAIAEARRTTTGSLRIATAELPVVLEAPQAALMADTWLYESWNARERASFSLPPSALALEPSDLLRIGSGGRERLMRVTEIGDGGRREVTALGIDPAAYDRLPAQARLTPSPPPPVYGIPEVAFLDLPLLRGDEIPHEGYVAAFQSPWPGGAAFYRSPDTTGYMLKALAPRSAIMGRTLSALALHAPGRWDRANALVVRILAGDASAGELSSATELALLEGRNLAALSRPDGSWEVLQFRTVELIAPNTYRLTQLLRGQAGSDASSASTVLTDATFILLDGAITPVGLSLADLHRPFNWRYGPANKDIGSASYATRALAFHGVGLRPLSPVHVRATRATNGDMTLSWIRRTRIGGDSWELADVPLGEDSERYEIDILDPAAPAVTVRTLSASAPSVIYAQAQQIADFGAPQSACHVRVHQLSALLGRGAAVAAIV
jgi:GTA TIM-barrel-like domain/Putative phage tail protein